MQTQQFHLTHFLSFAKDAMQASLAFSPGQILLSLFVRMKNILTSTSGFSMVCFSQENLKPGIVVRLFLSSIFQMSGIVCEKLHHLFIPIGPDLKKSFLPSTT